MKPAAVAVALITLLGAASTANAAKVSVGPEVPVFQGGGSAADVVYDGDTDQLLVVWISARTVFGRLMSHDLAHAGAVFRVSAPDEASGWPKAAYNPERREYLVVWPALGEHGGRKLVGQRLGADGSEIGADDFPIAAETSLGSLDVAFRSGHDEYAVAWDEVHASTPGPTYDVYVRRVSGAGEPLGDAIQVSDPDPPGHLAAVPTIAYGSTNDQYLVAWVQMVKAEKRDVVGRLVGAENGSFGDLITVSSGPQAYRTAPQAANRPGSGFFVVWEEEYDYTGAFVAGESVTASGEAGGSGFAIRYPSLPGPFRMRGSTNPAVVFDPPSAQFEVVWQSAPSIDTPWVDEIYGMTRSDGTGPYEISSPGGAYYNGNLPVIAYDGRHQEDVVVWSSSGPPGEGYTILARRLASVAPPPEFGALDERAPRVRVGIQKLQRIVRQRGLVLRATCDEACTVRASARVELPGASRSIKLRPTTRSLTANARTKLKLKTSKRTLRKLRRAFKRRHRLGVRVTVTATDPSGNRTVAKRKLRARR